METGAVWFYVIQVLTIISAIVPFWGIGVLLGKEQNKASTYLVMATLSAAVMNASNLLMMQSAGRTDGLQAWKFLNMSKTMYLFFFVVFVLEHLKIKVRRCIVAIYAVANFIQIFSYWDSRIRDRVFQDITITEDFFENVNRIQLTDTIASRVVNGSVCFILFLALFVNIHRIVRAATKSERKNYVRLLVAQAVGMSTTVASVFLGTLIVDLVPFGATVSVMIVIYSVLEGDFFSINDMGRLWAVENMDELFYIMDAKNRLTYANHSAFEKGLFTTKDIGKKVECDCKLHDHSDSLEPVEFEGRYYRRLVTPIVYKDELTGYSVEFMDVTYQMRLIEDLEREKDRAESAVKARSDFMSNMSHEIRTPMNAIVGMTDIMLRDDICDEHRSYLMNIKNSGTALLSIINDILDFNKIDAGKMELVEDEYDPMSMFNDIRMILLNRIGDKPIQLVFDIDKTLPAKLYGDALRLRQVIINIGNNAVKFTDKGSVTISLRVNSREDKKIELAFSIKDTGQGIKEEDMDKLFGAFSQVDTKKNHSKEGTGLGLAISKQIVELMDGNIGVDSQYGVGTDFYFTVVQESRSDEAACNIDDVYKIKHEKNPIDFIAPEANILLVDDNEMNRKVAIGLLAPLNMHIETAENGQDAIYKVEKNKYDLIFMDHMMPIMDGCEATIQIRKMPEEYFQNVPIIALSANVLAEAKEEFYSAGMNDFVAKPINMPEICSALKKYLPEEKIHIIDVVEEIGENNNSRWSDEDEHASDFEKLTEYGFDYAKAVECSGSRELMVSLLSDYYKLIDMKSTKIEKCLADGLIKDYRVEVHALKSTSRMIGFMELSEQFKELEYLADDDHVAQITEKTPGVLDTYRKLKPQLKPFAVSDDVNKHEADATELKAHLSAVREAVEAFDLDSCDDAFKQLEECITPPEWDDDMEALRAYVADVAMEDILSLTEKLINTL